MKKTFLNLLIIVSILTIICQMIYVIYKTANRDSGVSHPLPPPQPKKPTIKNGGIHLYKFMAYSSDYYNPEYEITIKTDSSGELKMSDRHGGNIDEFPKHLQIREFPKT
ncbi:MAG: hypothetical protein ACHQ1D_00030 [Nitrososphaerales archaeon]